MVIELFQHIANEIKVRNPWIKSSAVNCIQLPDGRVVNILGEEKEEVNFDDRKGTGFYIQINPQFSYSKQKPFRSDVHEYLCTINFRFVFFAINQPEEMDPIALQNIFANNIRTVNFSTYVGEERKIETVLINSNFDATAVFKQALGKQDESGAKLIAVSVDGQLKFLSSNDNCENTCIPLKPLCTT